MREKFPDYNIGKGFDWIEAVYNAIMPNNDDGNLNVSEKHIERGRRHAKDIRLRLQPAINPNIGQFRYSFQKHEGISLSKGNVEITLPFRDCLQASPDHLLFLR